MSSVMFPAKQQIFINKKMRKPLKNKLLNPNQTKPNKRKTMAREIKRMKYRNLLMSILLLGQRRLL
jgi:hypothetical protein